MRTVYQPVEAQCRCASERRMVLTYISSKSGKSMRCTAGKTRNNRISLHSLIKIWAQKS